MADLFDMALAELRQRIVGEANLPALRSLALLGVRYLAGHDMLRCLVVGEPSTGKSTAVHLLAQVTGLRLLRVPIQELPQTTWSGGADLLDRIRAAVAGIPRPEDAERMLLLLDGLECVRLTPWEVYGTSERGQREGRQQSLEGVWQGDEVTVDDDWPRNLNTSRFLVIGCLQTDDLPHPYGAADLVRWGFTPALADRIAMATSARLYTAEAAGLVEVAVREAERLAQPGYAAFGYHLEISVAAAWYALRASRSDALSTRGLIGVLRQAADDALIELVAGGARRGTRRVLGPDDITPRSGFRGE